MRHGWLLVFSIGVSLFISGSHTSAAPGVHMERHGAGLKVQLSNVHSGDRWELRGQRGQVCATGVVRYDGDDAVEFAKIASNEALEFTVSSAGDKRAVATMAVLDRRSTLPKSNINSIIYQIPVRTYAATGRGIEHVGRLSALNDEVMAHLKALHVDYIWLTGVLEQASARTTDPDVVKGDAGSYYAVRDMWDVAPELGGLSVLEEVIARAHAVGIRILIDLVPNHTSRLHQTDVTCKGDLNFGDRDDTSKRFDINNNYYYLPGQPFVPPHQHIAGTDGVFDRDIFTSGTQMEDPAKVTGNDVISARPQMGDWFETVKLNYGYDFDTRRVYSSPRPRTWDQILDVAHYWQLKGVDGFRLDFAHVVPMEFWHWFSSELRKNNPHVFLVAEAYESGKRVKSFSYDALFGAGIDSVFHSELYWRLHDQAKHAGAIRTANPLRMPSLRQESVRNGRTFTHYLENHDELRVASPHFAPDLPSRYERAQLGAAFSAYAGLLPGNTFIHGGQEFSEDASVYGAFAGDSGKTSIFDFVFQAFTLSWWRGEASNEMRDIVSRYQRFARLKKTGPFQLKHSETLRTYYDLEPVHWDQDQSKWIAAYVRVNPQNKETYLVVLNSHPMQEVETTLHFTRQQDADSFGILEALGIDRSGQQSYRFVDQLHRPGWIPRDPALASDAVAGQLLFRSSGVPSGLHLGKLPPRSTSVFKMELVH